MRKKLLWNTTRQNGKFKTINRKTLSMSFEVCVLQKKCRYTFLLLNCWSIGVNVNAKIIKNRLVQMSKCQICSYIAVPATHWLQCSNNYYCISIINEVGSCSMRCISTTDQTLIYMEYDYYLACAEIHTVNFNNSLVFLFIYFRIF